MRIDANRYRDRHPEPEDIYLIIEVAGYTLRRDRKYKAPMYAKARIPEYWVINLQGSQVIVYRHLQNNVYGSEQIFESTVKVSLGHSLILRLT